MGLRDRNMGDSGVGIVVAGARWCDPKAMGVKQSAGRCGMRSGIYAMGGVGGRSSLGDLKLIDRWLKYLGASGTRCWRLL